jgi:hypothetical protein
MTIHAEDREDGVGRAEGPPQQQDQDRAQERGEERHTRASTVEAAEDAERVVGDALGDADDVLGHRRVLAVDLERAIDRALGEGLRRRGDRLLQPARVGLAGGHVEVVVVGQPLAGDLREVEREHGEEGHRGCDAPGAGAAQPQLIGHLIPLAGGHGISSSRRAVRQWWRAPS